MLAHRLMLMASFGLLVACGGDQTKDTGQTPAQEAETTEMDAVPTILELIVKESRFSSLRRALEAAEFDMTFDTEGPLTLFAPNNEAFARLPEAASLDVLTAPQNRALLQRILAYHVVPGRLGSEDLAGTMSETMTLEGASLSYDGTGAVLTVGQAPGAAVITIADIEASNGIIHVVDSVLLPPAE